MMLYQPRDVDDDVILVLYLLMLMQMMMMMMLQLHVVNDDFIDDLRKTSNDL
jgi:hypothetical protein